MTAQGTTRAITIVAGVSRSGKSTFALRYLCNAELAYRFIFNSELGPQSYAVRLDCDSAADEFELGMQLCSGWVVFNPHVHWPGQLAEAFNYFCDWTWRMSAKLPGRKVLVVEEAWRFVSPQRYPKELAACVQSGAAYGLGCVFNTQTPEKLPGPIQGECSEVVCFKLGAGGEKSLAWAEGRGFAPEELTALPQLSYVARNLDSGGELRGRIEL